MLATPYGPATTARYYHLLLVDPPFAGQVTEWRWPAPASNTYAFYVLLAIAVPLVVWGRRRLTVFDIAVLALTLAGALTAIRGIAVVRASPAWSSFPVAIGRRLESRSPGEPRRGLNTRDRASGSSAALLAVAGALFFRERRVVRGLLADARPVEAVRAELGPDDRVFAPDRFSDWLLWKIPELRGRIAYDVRFELYDKEFFDRLGGLQLGAGADWKSFADGYRIVVVDETNRSHTADFLDGARSARDLRDDELTVIARARRPDASAPPEDDDAVPVEHLRPGGVASRAARRTRVRPWDAS